MDRARVEYEGWSSVIGCLLGSMLGLSNAKQDTHGPLPGPSNQPFAEARDNRLERAFERKEACSCGEEDHFCGE